MLAARAYAGARATRARRRRWPGAELLDACGLTARAQRFLEESARAQHLSGRGVTRLLRVARTCADLEGEPSVGVEHLGEALGYRAREAGLTCGCSIRTRLDSSSRSASRATRNSSPRRRIRPRVLYGIGDPALSRARARRGRRAQGDALRAAGGAALRGLGGASRLRDRLGRGDRLRPGGAPGGARAGRADRRRARLRRPTSSTRPTPPTCSARSPRCGAVVSEHPWGTPPQRWTFRTRNRIIAGLSAGLLVLEAGLPSGTFSTADYALAAGRDVFVVPGSIFAPECRGANRLLHQGATPVSDVSELADALAIGAAARRIGAVRDRWQLDGADDRRRPGSRGAADASLAARRPRPRTRARHRHRRAAHRSARGQRTGRPLPRREVRGTPMP